MTSDEIKQVYVEVCETIKGTRAHTSISLPPLWEIAYQLALMNERSAAKFRLEQRLKYSQRTGASEPVAKASDQTLKNPNLVQPEQPEGDADSERGKCPECGQVGVSQHAPTCSQLEQPEGVDDSERGGNNGPLENEYWRGYFSAKHESLSDPDSERAGIYLLHECLNRIENIGFAAMQSGFGRELRAALDRIVDIVHETRSALVDEQLRRAEVSEPAAKASDQTLGECVGCILPNRVYVVPCIFIYGNRGHSRPI